MKNADPSTRLVYSTSLGVVCPGCAKPVKACVCRKMKRIEVPKPDGVARLRYETQGRKGKGVTLIIGLPLNQERLLELARQLKQRFGTGGAVKDHIIELQGDHRRQTRLELGKLGYSVK
jgi:translation initiation factor 1